MATSGHPGKIGGEQAAKNSNLGGGLGGGGTGNGAGGQSKSLLDSKYPGAANKKNKKFGLTGNNVAQLIGGTLLSAGLGPVAGTVVKGAINTGLGINPMNPFDDPQGDTASVGAGYADGGPKDERMTPAEKTAAMRSKVNKKTKLSKGFTLLAGAGGTLLGS